MELTTTECVEEISWSLKHYIIVLKIGYNYEEHVLKYFYNVYKIKTFIKSLSGRNFIE